jgi:predicted O-methyltransferase YrrM
MTDERWAAGDHPAAAALENSRNAGLPAINVSPPQGKFLHLLARSINARHVLEIGTLGGYSTIWIASALPADGRLVTLEANPDYAELARRHIEAAGFGAIVEVRVGPALESLPALADLPPFDLAFIDADKVNNPAYFAWALKLSRPGSVIIVDNVVRNGAILEENSSDPNVLGTRELFTLVESEPRVSATVIQTVGSKGYDGFAMAYVIE